MKIEHLAIWAKNIDVLKDFYVTYFGATSNQKYHNPQKEFQSYFLEFESGSRLELMQIPDLISNPNTPQKQALGFIHLAFSVGNAQKVNELTEKLRENNFVVLGEPRTTGDGYYESLVLDPEGNRIEITI